MTDKTANAIETAIKVLKETLHGGNTVPCWNIAEAMIELEKTLNDHNCIDAVDPERSDDGTNGPLLERPFARPVFRDRCG